LFIMTRILLLLTDSDYTFGIFKLFLLLKESQKVINCVF